MNIASVLIHPPTKAKSLASAEIEFTLGNKQTLRIIDLRVMKNANGELWVAMPSRSINGDYRQLVFSSVRVRRMIEDAVIAAYERWTSEQSEEKKGGAR